jgi:uncharacterized membrane protein YccC
VILGIGDSVFPFWPRTVENRAAIRTAVAVLVAVLLAFKFHLQNPYWSGMSVVIVANLYTGSIIDKALMRVVGTVVGAFLGFYLAGLVANSLILYLLACFLIIAVSVYYYQYSSYGYAYLLGALCAFIIIAQITINPESAFFVAVWRPMEIGLGVLVFSICVYAIFPNHLKDSVFIQVTELFDEFENQFCELSQAFSQEEINLEHTRGTLLRIKKKVRKATELIGAMNHELGVTKDRIDELRALLETFLSISRQVSYLSSFPVNELNEIKLYTTEIQAIFSAVIEDCLLLKSIFINREEETKPLRTATELHLFEQQVERDKQRGNFIYSFVTFVQQVDQNLQLIGQLLMRVPVAKKGYIVLNKQSRLRADHELVKHSIKAGIAVLLAMGFWLISNWPGGINGIVSSLVISIRRNLLEMKHIIIHRLIGCSLGGGSALVALAVVEMNLYDLITLLFFAVWAFSYFMFKFPKYSYIGLQANIALIITLAQEGGPTVLLDPPLQRLAGVVIGIVASFIVANVLWRTDIWKLVNTYLDRLYNYIACNFNQFLMEGVNPKAFHDLSSLFWLSRGLLESLSDQSLSVKKQKLLDELRKKFEVLVITQASVSTIIATIDRTKAVTTAALFNCNLASIESQVASAYGAKDKLAASSAKQQLDFCSTAAESTVSSSLISYADLRNLISYLNALRQIVSRV